MLDPTGEYRADPEEEQILDAGMFRSESGELYADTRTVGTRTVERRKRLDAADVLFDVLPDLRGQVRTPRLRRVEMFEAAA